MCTPKAPPTQGRSPDFVRSAYFASMSLTGKRLAFIGGGTMAEAMIRGLLDRHLVPPSHVLVTGPRRERRAELTKTYNVKALASNADAAKDAHVVVLSVKPQVLAARRRRAGAAHRRRVRALRAEERPAPRGAAQHGHVTRRHERCRDLSAREGRAPHGALEGRVRGVPADA